VDQNGEIDPPGWRPSPPPSGFEQSSLLINDVIPLFPAVEGTQFSVHKSCTAPCSRTCGAGWQLQPSVCVSKVLHTTSPLDVCLKDLEQHDTRIMPCSTQPCSTSEPHWEVGDWRPSSALCDGGFQSRDVECKRNGLIADTASCGSLSHPQMRSSFTSPCTNFGWFVGPWDACGTECGWGRQSRQAVCVDLQNATVPDRFCPHLQPDLQADCYLGPCYAQPSKEAAALGSTRQLRAAPAKATSLNLSLDSEGEEAAILRHLLQSAPLSVIGQEPVRCAPFSMECL
jgi:hypothetical protein